MIEPISNIKIYGLEDSIRRSKYPKSVDIETLNNDVTETVKKLAGSRKGEGHDSYPEHYQAMVANLDSIIISTNNFGE